MYGTAQGRARIRAQAEEGDAEAQFNLGILYEDGKGVSQDAAEAVRWYSLSADQGFREAQYLLGLMCDEGTGVAQDHSKAVEWWLKASEQGHPMAQCNLGGSYFDAIGVPEDCKEGLKWLQLSAEQGQEEALTSLNFMQQADRITAPSPGAAVTTVLLTAGKAAEYNGKPGVVAEPPSADMSRPGIAFVLLDGEQTPKMFKAMNLQLVPESIKRSGAGEER